MPKRTTTTVIKSDEDRPSFDDIFERARWEEENKSVSTNLIMTVYRYGRLGKVSYLDRIVFDRETHNQEWLRAMYGPGEYQVRFHFPASAGEDTPKGFSHVISIDALPGEEPKRAVIEDSGASRFMDTVARQNDQMFQAIIASLGQGKDSGLATVMAAMVQGQNQVNQLLLQSIAQPKQDNIGTFLTLADKLADRFVNMKADAAGPPWLAVFRALASDLAPVLREVMTARAPRPPAVVGELPAEIMPRPALSIAKPPLPTPGEGLSSTEQNAIVDGVNVNIKGAMLEGLLPAILQRAQEGSKPGETANEILDHIPPAAYEVIDQLTPEEIIEAEPGFVPFKPWLLETLSFMKANEEGERGYDEPEGA